jgi:exodeoxyribonuclease V alpha subunit
MSSTTTVKVEKVIFSKGDFAIFAVSDLKLKQKFSAKGVVLLSPADYVGLNVVLKGHFETGAHGNTFCFDSVVVEEGAAYFWERVAKITKKSQANIISRFGADPSWLSHERNFVLQRLASVPGIKLKTSLRVLDNWLEYQSIKNLMEVTAPFKISANMSARILKHFGDKAYDVIVHEPYRLVEVNGLGFKKTDEIALRVGVSEKDAKRYMAAFSYVMGLLNQQGSTLISDIEFMTGLNDILVMSDGSVAFSHIDDLRKLVLSVSGLAKADVVYLNDNMLALDKHLKMDAYILDKLGKANQSSFLRIDADKVFDVCNFYVDFSRLGEQQQEAVCLAMSSGSVVAVKGFAGTGKTTTSKTLLSIMSAYFNIKPNEIIACALSGVAANRIKNQSGYNAMTINSLLGYADDGGFLYNESNPLPYRVVILDESGMVDSYLFYSLLKAIDVSLTKLIMLGDTAQVPPVGAGQPFQDIIDFELVPVASLTKIYRQSEDQAIAWVASQIREGKRPPIQSNFTDVFSYRAEGQDNEAINQAIERKLMELAGAFKPTTPIAFDVPSCTEYLFQTQVITPRRTGVLGQEDLNIKLRSLLLPKTGSDTVGSIYPIGLFEKVIHLHNEKMKTVEGVEVKVFNGMLGVVVEVRTEDDEVVVFYPLDNYSVAYTVKQFEQGLIGYAWALTIHKTQGSEFTNVIIPFSNSHWMMLNNKLTYTAVTRPKKTCHLIGHVKAFHHACTNVDTVKRQTVLAELAIQKSRI